MIILFGLFIIICAVGLILKYRTSIRKQDVMVVWQHSRFSNCLLNLILLVFLIGFFIVVFGDVYLIKTYNDNLLLNLLLTTFLMVGAVVAFLGTLAELIAPVHDDFFESRNKRIFFLSSGSFIFLSFMLAAFIFILPDMIDVLKGLHSGPQLTSGIIEGKYTGYSRAGTLYYVRIDGESRQLKDSQWWHSLEAGDEIAFLENPYSQTMPPIFKPDQDTFTFTGILIIGLAFSFWVLMIWLAWEGYAAYFANGRFLQNQHRIPK